MRRLSIIGAALAVWVTILGASYSIQDARQFRTIAISSGTFFSDTTAAIPLGSDKVWSHDEDQGAGFTAFFRLSGTDSLVVFPSVTDDPDESWIREPGFTIHRGEVIPRRFESRRFFKVILVKWQDVKCQLSMSYEIHQGK